MTTLNVATTINSRFDHVTPIEATRSDVTITHRCHTLAELLAVARSGLADMILIADEFDLLSLEFLGQIRQFDGSGIHIVAISDIEQDRIRLAELGIPVVAPHMTGTELVEALVAVHHGKPIETTAGSFTELIDFESHQKAHENRSVKRRSGRRAAPYDPSKDLPVPEQTEELQFSVVDELEAISGDTTSEQTQEASQPPKGHITAVWGPIGSPGVTTIAVNLAAESAMAGHRTLLIDADTYGAAVAVHLGLLDETAAIAQACRAAEHRGLNLAQLQKYTQRVKLPSATVDVLTGLTRSERWPQLRGAAWNQVLDVAQQGWDEIVIDCGFGLEEDEELSFDIPAPQRNITTIAAMTRADTVVAVGTGDPVGLVRFMRSFERLDEIISGRILPIINKVSAMTSGISPKRQLKSVWDRFGPNTELQQFIVWAPEVVAGALLSGKVLAETAPKAEIRIAIQNLMHACVPTVRHQRNTPSQTVSEKPARIRTTLPWLKKATSKARQHETP